MNKKALVIIVILALTLGTTSSLKVTKANPTMRIVILSAVTGSDTLYATPGENLTVNINVIDAVDLYAWGMRIKWDPAVLNLTGAVEGPFLKSNAQSGTFFLTTLNVTAGFVDVGVTFINQPHGVDGDGTLLTLTFQVQSKGRTPIDIVKYGPYGEFIYKDVDNSSFVSPGDVRLTAVSPYPANSTVASGDTDILLPPPPGQPVKLISFNANETHAENVVVNGNYDPGEYIYVDADTSGNVTVGDIRLSNLGSYPTGLTSGTTVSAEDPEIGSMLISFNADEKHAENVVVNGNYDPGVLMSVFRNSYLFKITPVDFEHAIFNNLVVHDIAITSVTASPTFIPVSELGRDVVINVTVWNKGEFDETFNLTVSYITVLYEDRVFLRRFEETFIERETNLTVVTGENQTFTFSWNTTAVNGGDHRIKAAATIVGGEANIANNVVIGSTVRIAKHDVTISSISAIPQNATPGEKVTIDVIALNIGDYTESFNVSLYYDKNFIGKQPVTLEPGANKTLTFEWDTTGVPVGGYMINAIADPVPGEVLTEDNSLTVSWENAVQIQVLEAAAFPTSLVGGGVALAIAVVLALAYYLTKRRPPKKIV